MFIDSVKAAACTLMIDWTKGLQASSGFFEGHPSIPKVMKLPVFSWESRLTGAELLLYSGYWRSAGVVGMPNRSMNI
jgi:hypothetical protein